MVFQLSRPWKNIETNIVDLYILTDFSGQMSSNVIEHEKELSANQFSMQHMINQ